VGLWNCIDARGSEHNSNGYGAEHRAPSTMMFFSTRILSYFSTYQAREPDYNERQTPS
jgi:hypothetical protein